MQCSFIYASRGSGVMIEIDGSYGEGGGQILRSSISLSVLTGKPVLIKNIRANRPNPGLRAQHLTAVRVLKEISNASAEGLEIGSPRLEFHPKAIEEDGYRFDIGTAGSITLVLQTIIPLSFEISKPISLTLRGGTDVRWSPTWNYFNDVFLHIVKAIGIDARTKLIRRGFYPKGGGEVEIEIFPVQNPKPLLLEEQEYSDIGGVIAVSKLKDDIPKRIKHSVIKTALERSISCQIDVDRDDESPSEGVSITLWSDSKESKVGASEIGEKGLPSEKLGRIVAENVLKEIESRSSLDIRMADQILVYLAYISAKYGERSFFFTREITGHTRTNAWLIEKFLPVKIIMNRVGKLFKIEIRGI